MVKALLCPICKLDIPEDTRATCLCRGGDGAPIKWVTREELQKLYAAKTLPEEGNK